MPEIVMPRLSDSMEEGTILTWMKQIGEEIAVGEEIVEIETDKANMAYEADVAGTLTEILAQEGDTVTIGEPIALVGDSGEGRSATAAGPVADEGASSSRAAGETPSSAPPAAEAVTASAEAPSAGGDDGGAPGAASAGDAGASEGSGRVKASPVARRLAREEGVDLSRVAGTGPGGRIVKKDVEQAAKEGAQHPARLPHRRRPPPPPRARPPRARSRSRSSRGCSRSSPGGCRSPRRPRRTSTSKPRST